MAAERPDTGGEVIWRVSRIQPENHDVTSMFLEGKDPKFASRRAGQYAVIRVMRPEGWSEPHPFTISCAPEADYLQFTIKAAGAFTSSVRNIEPGTPVKCLGPNGTFCRDIDDRPSVVLIAGGVGITPFLSVLRHFHAKGASNEVMLFWSNKTFEDVFCLEEISGMSNALNLKVVHNLSREDDPKRHLRGGYPNVVFESGRLDAGVLSRYGVNPKAAFYLCGPPPMMDSVLQELSTLGVDPEAVEREKFSWK